jgi:hypothetical protein
MRTFTVRLYEVELQKREAEKLTQEAAKTDIGSSGDVYASSTSRH